MLQFRDAAFPGDLAQQPNRHFKIGGVATGQLMSKPWHVLVEGLREQAKLTDTDGPLLSGSRVSQQFQRLLEKRHCRFHLFGNLGFQFPLTCGERDHL